MIKLKKYILINSLILISCIARSQDTIRYSGFLNIIIYESIELYSDSTFKWTSEYDLNWSDYGYYSITGDTLQLDFYRDLKDKTNNNPATRTNRYLIDDNKLFLLSTKGKVIKRIKDKSFRSKWSWITNGRHKFYFIKQN